VLVSYPADSLSGLAGSSAPQATLARVRSNPRLASHCTSVFHHRGLGLIYVDFDTLERIPKLSAEWFREAARRNAVV
jgi:hypothetical protein